jgi:hypothetical protein
MSSSKRPAAKYRRLSVTSKRIMIQRGLAMGYSDEEIVAAVKTGEYQDSTIYRMIREIRSACSKKR